MAENLDGPLAAGAADVREEFRSLIQAAKAGSPEPLGQLLQTCRNYLLLVATHELPPELRAKGGASDLVQETFLIAQKQFPRFDGCTEGELLAWLKGILRNTSAHFRRGYQAAKRGGAGREVAQGDEDGDLLGLVPDDATPPSSRASRREMTEILKIAIERIDDRDRNLLEWRQKEELTFEEIGRRLSVSPVAARKAWFRAIERLRQAMDDLVPPSEDSIAGRHADPPLS
jgi:RNA polymerase sigma-70 factor (ECF subfamily)